MATAYRPVSRDLRTNIKTSTRTTSSSQTEETRRPVRLEPLSDSPTNDKNNKNKKTRKQSPTAIDDYLHRHYVQPTTSSSNGNKQKNKSANQSAAAHHHRQRRQQLDLDHPVAIDRYSFCHQRGIKVLRLDQIKREVHVTHSERLGLEKIEGQEEEHRGDVLEAAMLEYSDGFAFLSRELRKMHVRILQTHGLFFDFEARTRTQLTHMEEKSRVPISHARCAAEFSHNYLSQIVKRGAILEDDMKRERKQTARDEEAARKQLLRRYQAQTAAVKEKLAKQIDYMNIQASSFSRAATNYHALVMQLLEEHYHSANSPPAAATTTAAQQQQQQQHAFGSRPASQQGGGAHLSSALPFAGGVSGLFLSQSALMMVSDQQQQQEPATTAGAANGRTFSTTSTDALSPSQQRQFSAGSPPKKPTVAQQLSTLVGTMKHRLRKTIYLQEELASKPARYRGGKKGTSSPLSASRRRGNSATGDLVPYAITSSDPLSQSTSSHSNQQYPSGGAGGGHSPLYVVTNQYLFEAVQLIKEFFVFVREQDPNILSCGSGSGGRNRHSSGGRSRHSSGGRNRHSSGTVTSPHKRSDDGGALSWGTTADGGCSATHMKRLCYRTDASSLVTPTPSTTFLKDVDGNEELSRDIIHARIEKVWDELEDLEAHVVKPEKRPASAASTTTADNNDQQQQQSQPPPADPNEATKSSGEADIQQAQEEQDDANDSSSNNNNDNTTAADQQLSASSAQLETAGALCNASASFCTVEEGDASLNLAVESLIRLCEYAYETMTVDVADYSSEADQHNMVAFFRLAVVALHNMGMAQALSSRYCATMRRTMAPFGTQNSSSSNRGGAARKGTPVARLREHQVEGEQDDELLLLASPLHTIEHAINLSTFFFGRRSPLTHSVIRSAADVMVMHATPAHVQHSSSPTRLRHGDSMM